jgi:anti-sigma B factor antagonist
MSMEINEREKEGIRIFDLGGRMTVGEAAAVRDRTRELLAGDVRRFLFNLQEVDYIDSTGLGVLVMCFTAVEKAGGGLKLLNLNRRNVELLVLTKLITVFEIFNDEQDAVNSFFPNREIRRFDILEFVRQQREE